MGGKQGRQTVIVPIGAIAGAVMGHVALAAAFSMIMGSIQGMGSGRFGEAATAGAALLRILAAAFVQDAGEGLFFQYRRGLHHRFRFD